MSYISIIGSIFAIGFVIFAIAYPNYKRMKLQEATRNMMYVIIAKPGAVVTGLFPADDLTVDIPVEVASIGGNLLKKKEKGVHSVILHDNAVKPIQYPPHAAEGNRSAITKWFSPTVSIRSICVAEGSGLPWIAFEYDEEGNPKQKIGTEASIVAAYKRQAHAKMLAILGQKYAEEAEGRASGQGGAIKKSDKNLIFIALIVILVVAGVGAYFGYASNAEIMSWGW